jgi:hypothetical protein
MFHKHSEISSFKNIGNNSFPTSQTNTVHVDYKDTIFITFKDVIANCCQVIPDINILRGKNVNS